MISDTSDRSLVRPIRPGIKKTNGLSVLCRSRLENMLNKKVTASLLMLVYFFGLSSVVRPGGESVMYPAAILKNDTYQPGEDWKLAWSDEFQGELSEFHDEFFIFLDIAVGGTYAGQPDVTSPFPQYMYIDWVRVYQRT